MDVYLVSFFSFSFPSETKRKRRKASFSFFFFLSRYGLEKQIGMNVYFSNIMYITDLLEQKKEEEEGKKTTNPFASYLAT